MGLHAQLKEMGHQVISPAANSAEAEAVFRSQQPDLVLTDIRLGGDDGLDLAEKLLKIRACPILVISAYSDRELIDRAKSAGVFGYLVKPVSSPALAAQIEVAVARFREHMVLLAEKESLAANLENRKLIERAKGVLMKRKNLSESEAHKSCSRKVKSVASAPSSWPKKLSNPTTCSTSNKLTRVATSVATSLPLPTPNPAPSPTSKSSFAPPHTSCPPPRAL